MNPEDMLRRLRNDDEWHTVTPESPQSAAAHDDTEPMHLARRPERWVFFAVAASAVLLAVGALVATGVTRPPAAPQVGGPATASTSGVAPSSTSAAAVVPWLNAPAPAPSASSEGVRPATCTSDSLSVTGHDGDSTMGTFYVPVRITNRGTTTCSFTATDLDLFATVSGRTVHIADAHLNPTSRTFVSLVPGASTTFQGALAPCNSGVLDRNAPRMTLTARLLGTSFPLSGTLSSDLQPVCENTNTAIGESSFYEDDPEVDPTGPYTGLRATMTAPALVHAGTTITVDVTLTNPSTVPVRFTDCPAYAVTYADRRNTGSGAIVTRFSLNCAAAVDVPADGSRVFAVRMRIPTNGTGLAKLSWTLDVGPSTGVVRTITG